MGDDSKHGIGEGSSVAPLATEDSRNTRAIADSHQRSEQFGLDPALEPEFSTIAQHELRGIVERNRSLHLHAMPVMESLYENIINTHSMVLLTDANGLILHALGDDDFLQRARKVALAPGVDWSEQSKGTNAIGTALAEAEPTVVHADQHFLRANHFLTCSAVPILDPRGMVCGVLDVTGDFRSYHRHTMALVRMSAQIIENQLFNDAFASAIRVHFHSRPEFIGTLMEGIAAFDAEGRFLAGNRSALFQLGLSHSALRAHTFGSLFGLSLPGLLEHQRSAQREPIQTRLHNGLIAHLRGDLKPVPRWVAGLATIAATESAPTPPSAESARERNARMSSLRYLNTGDPQMAAVIHKVQRVVDRDIPIMIVGETGTGKELLAQAIHHDSPRSGMPLVAVNCASIPDTLIESELFGYEDGAFTGARKRGHQGRILAASGGTLFLDEIGDMPLALQARLLRVLQERVVTPLGSHKSIPVNLMLICATHRNLRDLVAKGAFREDLYYRLNGLVVRLPALRDRSDLIPIVEKILHAEPHTGPGYTVAPEVIELFRRYRWPGNFRQLHNLLRAAMVMADDDHVIRREHLPDDMLEEIGPPDAPHADQAQTSIPQPDPAPARAAPLQGARTAPASESIAPGALAQSLGAAERELILRTLDQCRGNISAAARALGISRNTIYRKLPHLRSGAAGGGTDASSD